MCRAEFPLKSDEEVDVLVTSAQSDLDKSNDIISTQSLNSLVRTSRVSASQSDVT